MSDCVSKLIPAVPEPYEYGSPYSYGSGSEIAGRRSAGAIDEVVARMDGGQLIWGSNGSAP